MRVAAIVVAGGRGVRAGGGVPKQFVDLGGGRSMVDMSVAAMLAAPSVSEVVVAVPTGFEASVAQHDRVRTVAGGARRQDSMSKALAAVSPACDLVLVHDAARPFVTPALVESTVAAAERFGAAIAAVPVVDTVKRVGGKDGHEILETLPRDVLRLAQTPQAFRREVLTRALARRGDAEVTDEAMIVELAGLPVHVVPGDPSNVKITTAEDLARARASSPVTTPRVGIGYDLHRLVDGRPLILGGVHIPYERGLLGHSDADLVCHAVTDAILGAAALGDIGEMFPDTDPIWKDADSRVLLQQAVRRLHGAGYVVVNVDITVIAERPKLRPHIDAIRASLAEVLGVTAADVGLKGKTNEKVDAAGREEAMACHAVALIRTA